jgi:hypothetical protein
MSQPPPVPLKDSKDDETFPLEADAIDEDALEEEHDQEFSHSPFVSAFLQRWKLYVPFLLVLFALGTWYLSWSIIRANIVANVTQWRAQEAREGRQWTCPQQSVSGFPFRIEVRCDAPEATINTAQGAVQIKLKALTVVGQVFTSGHLIAEATGPMITTFPLGQSLEMNWKNLQISLQEQQGIIVRASSVGELMAFRLNFPQAAMPQTGQEKGQEPVTTHVLYAEKLSIHLRPNPQLWSTQAAYDLAVIGENIASPQLDEAVGGKEPLQLSLESTLSQMLVLMSRPLPTSLDMWRLSGGRVNIASLQMRKGDKNVITRGDLTLDAQRRLEGRLDLSAAGIESVIQRLTDNNPQTNALIASGLSFLNRTTPNDSSGTSAAALKSMPPVRFEKGRIFMGPLPIGKLTPIL